MINEYNFYTFLFILGSVNVNEGIAPPKESFKEILVKKVFDEEILIDTQSKTKTFTEPETKPAETYPDLSENNTDLSNADIDEQQKTEIAENEQETNENSQQPITDGEQSKSIMGKVRFERRFFY